MTRNAGHKTVVIDLEVELFVFRVGLCQLTWLVWRDSDRDGRAHSHIRDSVQTQWMTHSHPSPDLLAYHTQAWLFGCFIISGSHVFHCTSTNCCSHQSGHFETDKVHNTGFTRGRCGIGERQWAQNCAKWVFTQAAPLSGALTSANPVV